MDQWTERNAVCTLAFVASVPTADTAIGLRLFQFVQTQESTVTQSELPCGIEPIQP